MKGTSFLSMIVCLHHWSVSWDIKADMTRKCDLELRHWESLMKPACHQIWLLCHLLCFLIKTFLSLSSQGTVLANCVVDHNTCLFPLNMSWNITPKFIICSLSSQTSVILEDNTTINELVSWLNWIFTFVCHCLSSSSASKDYLLCKLQSSMEAAILSFGFLSWNFICREKGQVNVYNHIYWLQVVLIGNWLCWASCIELTALLPLVLPNTNSTGLFREVSSDRNSWGNTHRLGSLRWMPGCRWDSWRRRRRRWWS